MIFRLLSYSAQPILFIIALIILYCLSPLAVYWFYDPNPYMLKLSTLCLLSVAGILLGYKGLSKALVLKPLHLIRIKAKYFIWIIFFIFAMFTIALIMSADNVPLFLAFKKANAADLVISRANFLKARMGYERIFLYINSVLTTSFLPYAILLSFVKEYRIRWLMLSIPYLYSFLFLEKVFFLKFLLPLCSFFASFTSRAYYKKYIIIGLISIPIMIYINTAISGFGGQGNKEHIIQSEKLQDKQEYEQENGQIKNCSNFYSSTYITCANTSRIKFIFWRTFAVPIITSVDSLKVFEQKYNNTLLLGSTSSFVSRILKMQNVKFEREVFKAEWGGEITGTASANAVFFIEQYVNFGWIGVLLSSILVGYIFAMLVQSLDIALASLAIVLSITLLCGALIATLLSGGFLLLFLFLYLVKLED